MAHEIKNPLASIKGLTQVLPENLDDQDFIKKYSEIVPRQLDRINRIVEDLLDFGQPAGLVMGEVDVAKELDGVLRLVENQCRKSDIEIIRDFQPLPPVIGNTEKLAQVFMNVILNAMQAMPNGGKLSIGSRVASHESIVIEIADTGEGIPADKLPNIFDPFYTTKESGTGMGLAVTHSIIKEHQGSIEAESKVGEGTTFKICLPIKPKPSV
jgi:signal transduction histidine kinase